MARNYKNQLVIFFSFYIFSMLQIIHTEELYLHDTKLEYVFLEQKYACAAQCLNANPNLSLRKCFENCPTHKNLEIKKINDKQFDFKFICRDDTSLLFEIVPIKAEINSQSLFNINYHSTGKLKQHEILLSTSTTIHLTNLKPGTTYNITVSAINLDNQLISIAKNEKYSTLEEFYHPSEVRNITFVRYEKNKNGLLNAIVEWQPAIDMNCHYDIIHYSTHDSEFLSLLPIGINDLNNLYMLTLESLLFSTEYVIGVTSKNPKLISKESQLKHITIFTPSCLEWHNSDLKICPPMEPKFLTVKETELSLNNYAINIIWERPIVDPDYYVVKILDLNINSNSEPKNYIMNITGEKTSAHINELRIEGHAYETYLTAYSTGGLATAMIIIDIKENKVENYYSWNWKIIVGTAGILVLILTILVYMFVNKISQSKVTNELNQQVELGSLNYFPGRFYQIYDEMEIDRNDLEILEKIGEGEFGLVYRGIMKSMTIAVKVLKEKSSYDEIMALRAEIERMKSVENHKNILGIVGHYTATDKDTMLLTEFCSRGNLLELLRSYRMNTESIISLNKTIKSKIFDEHFNSSDYCNKKPQSYKNINLNIEDLDNNFFTNHSYGFENDGTPISDNFRSHKNDFPSNLIINEGYDLIDDSINKLTSEKLLTIAKEIAQGMEHLGNNQIVHRDLAARNILVCQDYTVKISDFGLSRDGDIYVKQSNGKIPFKWLALESLKKQEYTFKSDVWSFGILLYEIVTLGKTPYHLENMNILRLQTSLEIGYRIQKTKYCSDQLYDLMSACWRKDPDERPSFTEIVKILDSLIHSSKNHITDPVLYVNNAYCNCSPTNNIPIEIHVLESLN